MTTYSLDVLLFLFGTSLLFHVQFHGFNPWISKILWGGNGNSPQYSCLENPMNRGPCQATVYFITKSQTWLARHGWSDLACTHIAFNSEGVLFHCLAFFDFYLVPLSSRDIQNWNKSSLVSEMVFEHYCAFNSQKTTVRNNFGNAWKFCPPPLWYWTPFWINGFFLLVTDKGEFKKKKKKRKVL